MREPLKDIIGKRVLICDGAMGTELMARGMKLSECGEIWNVDRAADVAAIHAAYIEAGCDLITTNTFGGTRTRLARHGLEGRVRELNRAGAKIAREAAGDRAWVLGNVGPFGDFFEPSGNFTVKQVRKLFDEQLAGLNEGGVDGVIVETMVDPREAALAIAAARALADWPVAATFTFSPGANGVYRTIMGTSAEEAVKEAIAAGATVIGTNCGTGMSLEDYVSLAKVLLKAAGKTPVIVQPNAGAPQQTRTGVKYMTTAANMGQLAKVLKECGVMVIGGCCGTSPAHLHAIATAVKLG